MKTYIDDFIKSIKKCKRNIQYNLVEEFDAKFVDNIYIEKSKIYNIPSSITDLYNRIKYFEIFGTHSFKLYSIDLVFSNKVNQEYLLFAVINNVPLCFDTRFLNSAGEWDIVNGNDGFLVTKTLASLFVNKIWAWVDRDRKIWGEEIY